MQTWRKHLNAGQVIPACPLALNSDGSWSERHQRALVRYYVDSGAGGLAVGVHSTQFAIRDPQHSLFKPLLQNVSRWLSESVAPDSTFVRIAGICGETRQAVAEAKHIHDCGYDAGLLSLAALGEASESELLEHALRVSQVIPIFGFYLQPAVGGRVLPYSFWRALVENERLVAIKMAPFNRYQTWDVIRAVIDSGREDIALYTGNDDNIVADLLTPFRWQGATRFIDGGLLGQWAVWTKSAVEMFREIKKARSLETLAAELLTHGAALTDANAAVFDAANEFAGCIPGINEVLFRQGLLPSNRCLDEHEVLSDHQAEELDRVCAAYPSLTDDEFVHENLTRWMA